MDQKIISFVLTIVLTITSPVHTMYLAPPQVPAIITKELSGTEWNSPFIINQQTLIDIGLLSEIPGSFGLKYQWMIGSIFPRFKSAPKEVRKYLINRLKRPSTIPSSIKKAHRNIQSFLDSFKCSDSVYDTESITKLLRVISLFSSYISKYHKELTLLHHKHYPSYGYSNELLQHREPYHDVIPSLFALATLISLLSYINDTLPEITSSLVKKWNDKLYHILTQPDVQFILSKKHFLSFVQKCNNMYLFGPLEYIQENPPAHIKAQFQQIDSDDDYFRDYDSSRKAAVQLYLELKEKEKEEFNLARKECDELVERFDKLWEVNVSPSQSVFKRNRKGSRSGAEDRFAFLRQFVFGLMQGPLVEIDYHCRIFQMIVEDGYTLPRISPQAGTVRLNMYKNPLINASPPNWQSVINIFRNITEKIYTQISKKEITPITVHLDSANNALILSGPNMGGKTMTARGIGLAVLCAQSGLPIPSKDPEMALFKSIYTIFPAPEQMHEGYGYFSWMIKQITELIKITGPGDLVILDEVPTGTDYEELVQIAAVLFEDLIKTGATVVITGHLKKAFEIVAQKTGQIPWMHTVKPAGDSVEPDYGLKQGIAKHSFAIELLSKTGFPKIIIKLAKAYYQVITKNADPSIIPVIKKSDLPKPVDPLPLDHPENRQDDERTKMLLIVVQKLFPQAHFALKNSRNKIFQSLGLPVLSDFGHFQRNIPAVVPVPTAEERNERLAATEMWKKQDVNFLNELQSSIFQCASLKIKRDLSNFFMRQAPLQKDQCAESITKLKSFVTIIVSNLKKINNNQIFDKTIEKCTTLLESDLPDLTKHYITEAEDVSSMQNQWKEDWNSLIVYITSYLEDIDMEIGNARSILKWELKKPIFSKDDNIFKLENSRPLSPEINPFDFGQETSPFVKDPVPQSFQVDQQKRVLVVTGANSSGKSIMIFNAYINAFLAMHGYYVSGDLEMSEYSKIYNFFGGRNEVTSGQSYFLNIIGQYARILQQVTPNSLVILDELHGTDNFELAAIQEAVLHYLNVLNCTVLFNTHVRDGLLVLDDLIGMDFWKTDVDFDPEKFEVMPKYTLSPDPHLTAKSYGLPIAKQWLTENQISRCQ